LQNICTVKLLSLSLHPQSGNNTGCNGSEKGFNSEKIKLLKNFSKKSFKNIWRFQKYALPLQPLSSPKKARGILKTVL
jgi:hypothetical protein